MTFVRSRDNVLTLLIHLGYLAYDEVLSKEISGSNQYHAPCCGKNMYCKKLKWIKNTKQNTSKTQNKTPQKHKLELTCQVTGSILEIA